MMIIDRFEGGIAVIETDSGIMNISKNELPDGAKEGDIIEFTDGLYVIDEEETKKRRESMADMFRKLTGGAE